jgi:membrane protein DedA with SNARE-associated domain
MESLRGLPFGLLYLALLGIVFARAQLTYWIGRLAGHGLRSRRWGRRLETPKVRRAEELLNRYGPAAVSVSFLTVGLQTAVNGGAGAIRMPFPRYLLAMLVGCAAWALVYSTIGIAALWAGIGLAARSPVGAAAVAVAAVLIVGAVVVLVRRRRARPAETVRGTD